MNRITPGSYTASLWELDDPRYEALAAKIIRLLSVDLTIIGYLLERSEQKVDVSTLHDPSASRLLAAIMILLQKGKLMLVERENK